MAKSIKRTTKRPPLIDVNEPAKAPKPSQSPLLLQRIKELDREFARQTKQLTELTKKLSKKLTKRL